MPVRPETAADLSSSRNLAAGVFGVFAAAASVVQAAGGQGWLRIAFAGIALVGAVVAVTFHWLERRAQRRDRRAAEAGAERARLGLLRTTLAGKCEHVPRLDELSPYDLGVDPESGEARAAAGGAEHAPYVSRACDQPIREAVAAAAAQDGPSLVVVEGEPLAGKSRTLIEAARATLNTALVLAPRDARSLAAMLEPGGAPELIDGGAVILWLDDLEVFASLEQGLNVDSMRSLAEWHRPVVVLATYGGKGQRLLGGTTRAGDAINQLLDRFAGETRFYLSSELTDDEQETARRTKYEPHAVEAMRRGIGEFMVAAPRLERKLTTGRHEPGEEPCLEGMAIVWAAIDWQRVGMAKPMSEQLLRELYVNYLTDPEASDAGFELGLKWALRPLYASVALLRRADGFLPYNHIVAFADRQSLRAVHPASWERILRLAEGEDAFRLGLAASARGEVDRARQAWRVAAESGNAVIAAPAEINAAEAEAQLVYLRRALEAATDEEREGALTEALLQYGARFGSALSYLSELSSQSEQGSVEPYRQLVDEYTALFERWVSGDRLTSRDDEDERRALITLEMARQAPGLGRLAAQAILDLPDGHPQRDMAEARRLLVGHLGVEEDDRQAGLELLAELIDLADPAEEELAERVARGLALQPGVDDATVRRFRLVLGGRYTTLAIEARDNDDTERQHLLAERGVRILQEMEPEPRVLLLLALLYEAAEDEERAAAALKAVEDASSA